MSTEGISAKRRQENCSGPGGGEQETEVDLEKKISYKMHDVIAKADFFTRKDMNELEARLETLEDEVRKMKNKEKMFLK